MVRNTHLTDVLKGLSLKFLSDTIGEPIIVIIIMLFYRKNITLCCQDESANSLIFAGEEDQLTYRTDR